MTTHLVETAADPLAALPVAGLPQNAKTAKTVAEAVGRREAILEAKYDGWRILAHRAADGVHLYSRTGNRYDGRLPEIEAEIAERFPVGTWLDGEAVAIRVDGSKVYNDWGIAQKVISSHRTTPAQREKVTYMVFDLLSHGGLDARGLTLAKRRALLEEVFGYGGFQRIQLSAAVEATEENHARFVALGFEGSMVKQLDSRYASGRRGAGWMKLKATATIDAVIIGYKDGENGFSGLVGAIEFGQYNDQGEMVARGRCSGMDMATREAISADRESYLGRVIEIAHMGVSVGETESGRFRHPQYKRFRDDKLAEQVTLHDC